MTLIHRMQPPKSASDTASTRFRTDRPSPAGRSPSPATDEIADAAPGLGPQAGMEMREDGGAGPDPQPSPEDLSGLRLLASDTRFAFLLVNEARYRAVHRIFGVSRDHSWLVTAIGLGLLAQTVNHKLDQLVRRPGGPTRADAILGIGALREASYAIAGPSSRNVPGFAALVAFSVTGHVMRPVVAGAIHGLRVSSHDVTTALHHRYGHRLKLPGRRHS